MSANERENQGHHDYIEVWFQTSNGPKHHNLLQQFLESYQEKQLVPRVLGLLRVHFSSLNMSTIVILLRKWIH